MAAILRFTTFNGVSLPQASAKHKVMGGKVRAVYTKVAGGWFDEYGSDPAPETRRELTLSATVHSTSQATLKTTLQGFEALRGVRASLVRTWHDATTESITARCIDFEFETNHESEKMVEVTFTFVLFDSWA